MKSRGGGELKSRLLKIGLKIWEDNNNLTGLATITWHAHIFYIFYTFSKFSSKYFIKQHFRNPFKALHFIFTFFKQF